MKKVFVDTFAWVSINDKKDQFHEQALNIKKDLLINRHLLYTTNFVLDETIKITDEIENQAWNLLKKIL